MRKHLFSDHNLGSVLEHQKRRLAEAIESTPASEIKGRSLDELVAYFSSQFVVASPELTEGAISATVEEAPVDVSGDWRRAVINRNQPCYVQGITASYFVPFAGDRNIFLCQPSTSYSIYPIAEVETSELLFRFQNADSDVAATKKEFDDQLKLVRDYLGHAKKDIDRVNAEIPAVAEGRLSARVDRIQKIGTGLQALGLPVRGQSGSKAHESRPVKAPNPAAEEKYDVALSFAGEDREYVDKVATLLKDAGVSVFYDKFETANLWGKNLVDHLAEIYQKSSRYVVMFVSEHYIKKPWPRHERAHAQSRAILAQEEYILPARFDDSEVPGLAGTVGYVSLRGMPAEEFAELIRTKISKNRHG